TGEVKLIIGTNVLWRWGLGGRIRERCRIPQLRRRESDNFLACTRYQTNCGLAARLNFSNMRPPRRQVAFIFDYRFSIFRDEELRSFKRFRNTNAYCQLSILWFHIDCGQPVGVLGRSDLLNGIPELAPGASFIGMQP